MFGVKDILPLLDQVPVWRALRELPKRVEALEARLAALEGKGARPAASCPRCGAAMALTSERPDPVFGSLDGSTLRRFECAACDFAEERAHDPRRP